jgi:serine/threonine protein kinase/WD40 repeat protein
MAVLVCSHCSKSLTINGRPPRLCPNCGRTWSILADTTRTADPAAPTVIQDDAAGPQTIGHYLIECEVGSGGFGTVYRARDPKLNRLVAIKVPHARSRGRRDHAERFDREARTLAHLRHPGIVPIYTIEQDGPLVFLVSEYVEGEPLDLYLKSNAPLSFRTAASLLAALASAADYAHSKGVVHRDIKPSNVMIDAAGNPRLMDFGLAKRDIDVTITQNLQILGTPAYMPPEQACGQHERVDRRSDVYSLGVVLYQFLTAALPYRGEFDEVRRKILTAEPPRPRSLNKQIPVDLETVCLKAMEKDAAKRYPTAGELAADLERWLRGEPILARHIGPIERTVRWAKRNPLTSSLVAAIALLLIVTTISTSAAAAIAEQGRRKEAEGKKKEEQLRSAEADARRKAEAALLENQRLLARAYVERGSRYQHVGLSTDDYSPIKSLPWLVKALEFDDTDAMRKLPARIRVQSQLDFAPRIEQMWFPQGQIALAGLSPTRDVFFTGTRDGTVDLWRIVGAPTPFARLPHPTRILAGTFSRDGALLATGSEDGVRVWDVKTGRLRNGPFQNAAKIRSATEKSIVNSNSVNLLEFSDSGGLVFASVLDGPAQVWDVATGAVVGKPIAAKSDVFSAQFANADKLLVLGHRGGATRVWDVQTGSKKSSLESNGWKSVRTRVAPDGLTIASATSDGKVFRWNAISGEKLGTPLADELAFFSDVRFSPNGKFIAASSNDGLVRLWRMADGQMLWKQRAFSDAVQWLRFSPDGAMLAAIHHVKGVNVLDTLTGKPTAQPISVSSKASAEASPRYAADWTNSRGRFLIGDRDGVVRLWSIESNEPAFQLPHTLPLLHTLVSGDRTTVATVDQSGACCVLRVNDQGSFEPNGASTFLTDESATDSAALAVDGSKIALSGRRTVWIWDTRRPIQLAALAHAEVVTMMRFTPDGRRIICLTRDGRVAVWEIATGRRLYEPIDIGRRFLDLDLDRQGDRCAIAVGKRLFVWRLADGTPVGPAIVDEQVIRFCRFLADPNLVLVVGVDGMARIWDVASGKSVRQIAKQRPTGSVSVSGDGRTFLTGDADGSARLWSSADASPASPVFQHAAKVLSAEIDATGRWVVTATGDASVTVWDRHSGEAVFARSIPQIQSRFPSTQVLDAQSVRAVFFDPNGRWVHIVTEGGVLISIGLTSDNRTSKILADDSAVRSGMEIDSAGGLKLLQSSQLASLWRELRSAP